MASSDSAAEADTEASNDGNDGVTQGEEKLWSFDFSAFIGIDGEIPPLPPPWHLRHPEWQPFALPGPPLEVEVLVGKDTEGHYTLNGFLARTFSSPGLPLKGEGDDTIMEKSFLGEDSSGGYGGEDGSRQQTHIEKVAAAPFLDLMCVNIFNYNHWEARKPLLIKELRQHLPGLIGFQEVVLLSPI